MTRPISMGLSLLSRAEAAGFERAQWAERHGYDSVWIPDGDGKMHALTLAGAVAATTQRVTIGTGIVPVYTHTPAVLAACCTAIGHLAPGRFILGVGSSSQAMMEKWNGIPFSKPLTKVRETVQVLRRMLAGERVEFQGETLSTSGFRLNPPPPKPVPIYLAALRPNMLELAGEVGDGVILNLVPLTMLPRMLEHVAAGAKRAGRTLADIDIAIRFNAVVGDDRRAALDDVRAFVQRYFTAPVYAKYFEWCGFGAEARAFADGFARGDRAATAAALTDEVMGAMGLAGNEADCQAQLRTFFAAGVTTAIINPLCATVEATDRTFAAFAPKQFKASA
jgi:probable F420-dependent oxidoreductase